MDPKRITFALVEDGEDIHVSVRMQPWRQLGGSFPVFRHGRVVIPCCEDPTELNMGHLCQL